ncbi:hypothetical protein ACQ7CU_18940 [Chryseobacterium arthrosphaerae]
MLFSNMICSVMSHVKRELYAKTQYTIKRSNLRKGETICFTENDLTEAEWREEKEFTLNGLSYDIISVSIVNGKKTYFCYIDKKDIIINSLLDFSKKLAVKKAYIKRQIDLPVHEKNIFKTSHFFVDFDKNDLRITSVFHLKIIHNLYNQSEKNHYLSIIIPPPEPAL